MTFAIISPAILAAVGIANDGATYVMKQTNLQSVADAAALTAAKELAIASADEDEIGAVAKNLINASLGDDMANAEVQVTVDRKESTVKVALSEAWTPFFAHFIKTDVTPIKTTATAMLAGMSNVCVLALDQKLEKGVYMTKSARVTANDCAIFTNSTHARAMQLDDSTTIKADLICSAGGVKSKPGAITPTPTSDCPPVADPLANRAPPPVGPCDKLATVIALGNVTLNPGVYCGGLTITLGAKVTFNPGVYVIKDGPFTVTGNAQIKGEHVGFYLTGLFSLIDFSKNTTVDLTGPKDGPMAGLLFYEDRNSTLLRMHWLNSANAKRLTGTIYLPKGYLKIDPNAPVAADSEFTAIIANRLEVREGPELVLNTDYDSTDVPVPKGIKASAQVFLKE